MPTLTETSTTEQETGPSPTPALPTPVTSGGLWDAVRGFDAAGLEAPRVPARRDVAALAALMALLALVWGRGRHTWYWTDEALSLGLSSHPLDAMVEVLRWDTAPPLYHVVLRGWISLFGSSEASTHTLSLLFALAVVPAALWAGWSLFGRRTGWMCALLAALSPFLATYANETRMYALVALLSVLTTATLVHAFAFGRRRYLPAFTILLSLTMYTHYWGLFLALGAGAGALVCLVLASDRRRVAIDAVLAFGGVAVLFGPWVPTLLYQRAHSAVGWALVPSVQVVRDDLVGLIGGPIAAAILSIGAGAALVALVRRPREPAMTALSMLGALTTVAVGAGFLTSRASSQWHGRYLGVVLAALILALGLGLARSGQLGVAALAGVALLSGPFAARVPLDAKSDIQGLVAQAAPLLEPGDVVFAPIGAVPLLAHYLGPGPTYITTTGPVADPLAADWRDAIERLATSRPEEDLAASLEGLALGGRVLVACPPVEESALRGLPEYIELEIRRCLQGQQFLLQSPGLEISSVLRYPQTEDGPIKARLLTKVALR